MLGIAAFVRRHLDPLDFLSEFLFGLIMVLSFTLAADLIVEEGEQATWQMLWTIIGCNIAWGLIDGGMSIVSSLCERSARTRLLLDIQHAASAQEALQMVSERLDPRFAPYTSEAERSALYPAILQRLQVLAPRATRVERADLASAAACFLTVLSTAVPAVLPFLFLDDRQVALRVSNALLLGLLFLAGWRWGGTTHSSRVRYGLGFLLAGLVMVGVALLFGG